MTSDAFDLRTTEFGSETEPVSPAGTDESFFIALDEPTSSQSADNRPTAKPDLSEQAKSAASPSTKPRKRRGKLFVETVEEGELDWFEKTKRAILGLLGVGLTVSLIFHFFGGVILTLLMLPGMLGNSGVNVNASMTDGQDESFEELDSSVELAGSADESQAPAIELQPVVTSDASQMKMENFLAATDMGNGADSKEGKRGEGSGFKFKMPSGGRAVTKGSFTVWTEPKDPRPGQNYRIVIQIRFPSKKKIRNYRLKDLSGMVMGTDTYYQKIPAGNPRLYARRRLKVIKNVTQYSVMVPGASQLVKDTIKIKSKMLKEEQTLEIVF